MKNLSPVLAEIIKSQRLALMRKVKRREKALHEAQEALKALEAEL